MNNYLELMHDVRHNGEDSDDRTGVGTRSLFGTKLDWDLREGFPAPHTKQLAWKAVKGELFWFLSGSTNVYDLAMLTHGDVTKPTIWTANYENQAKALGYKEGHLGPVYGEQFYYCNQLNNFIQGIIATPNSRRHIITLWNPKEIDAMALPPCHGLVIQANISKEGYLDMTWYQRSVDVFLGLPFNIASYALLQHIIAEICGLEVRKLTFMGGDTHVYNNHFDAVDEQLSRQEAETKPTLVMPKFKHLREYIYSNIDDFVLENYNPMPAIKAPMAV